MKALFDLAGLLLFVWVYRHQGIMVAIEWTMIFYLAQTLFFIFKNRKIDYVQLAFAAVIVVLGQLSLRVQNPIFFKWKPSLIYWLLALVLVSPHFIPRYQGTLLLKTLAGNQLQLPDFIWKRLTWAWFVFFLALGTVNLGVAYYFDTSTWVYFKAFGTSSLLILFIGIQITLCAKHLSLPEER